MVATDSTVTLRLRRKLPLAEGVLQLDFEPADGTSLPTWDPGAHLEIHLPSGLTRHYSLCGDPSCQNTYSVAVRREESGRGGSTEIHDVLPVGEEVRSSSPRNHFSLADGSDHVLIAGGIGITPIKTMVEELERRGVSWSLVYVGRSRKTMAFAEFLVTRYPGRVTIMAADEGRVPDLDELVRSLAPRTHVYCCGPARMLNAVTAVCEETGTTHRLHVERFNAGEASPPSLTGGSFEVELRETGKTVTVAENQSILDAIRPVLPNVPSSCQEGYCGTCETRVLEGRPEHRGTLLTPEEHDEEGTMLICVGRSHSDKLVLDL